MMVNMKNFTYAIGLFNDADIKKNDNHPVYLQLISHDVNISCTPLMNDYNNISEDFKSVSWDALSQNCQLQVVKFYIRMNIRVAPEFCNDVKNLMESAKHLYDNLDYKKFNELLTLECNLILKEGIANRTIVHIVEIKDRRISIVYIRDFHIQVEITPNTDVGFESNSVFFNNSTNKVCLQFESEAIQIKFYQLVRKKIMDYYLDFDNREL
jgi:hypothetical protein